MAHQALITGASNGIGRAIAARLAADGFQIITVDRVPPKQALPGELFFEADLADPTSTRDTLGRIVEKHPIYALVNNVGKVMPASVEGTSIEDMHAVVALNLGATLLCTQAVLPAMKERRAGRIVSISSRAALGKELRTSYAATKSALHGMTKTWALELGRHGITVNAIGPGPIDTELFRQVNPPDSPRTKAIIEGIPVKRMGTPEDVAHGVAGFVDPRAGFITGQVLYVCGGMTVGLAG